MLRSPSVSTLIPQFIEQRMHAVLLEGMLRSRPDSLIGFPKRCWPEFIVTNPAAGHEHYLRQKSCSRSGRRNSNFGRQFCEVDCGPDSGKHIVQRLRFADAKALCKANAVLAQPLNDKIRFDMLGDDRS